ncbi:MAG TPA: methyltransferase domain-containing protein [Actinophytocola sp.]|jgi:SAM-dependent methyltransferase|nr:methyltransferase domain-containing protein [Actinophytocola sp.]
MTSARPTNWGGEPGEFWAANDLRYDAMLAPLTPHLLDAAALTPADRVLDVGCGCGNTTRLAARQAGEVVGVDVSEAMLTRARQRTEEAGLVNARFLRGDAQTTPFEPADVVMSQLGVMFFADPAAAFANLRRTGGRLAFLCWQRLELNENRVVLREALGAYLDMPAPHTTRGALSLADPDTIRSLLGDAGFTDVELRDVREPLPAGRDADDAAAFALTEPSTAEGLAAAGPAAARQAADALRSAYAARETPKGVLLGSAAWLVTAR